MCAYILYHLNISGKTFQIRQAETYLIRTQNTHEESEGEFVQVFVTAKWMWVKEYGY